MKKHNRPYDKKWLYLFLAVSGFVLALYSYNVTRLLSPALLTGLLVLHWKTLRQIPRKTLVTLGIFGSLLLLPFLLTFFSAAGASSAQHALLTSSDIQAKNPEMRSYLVDSANFIGKVFFNNYVFMGWQYLENLVSVFSADFFFISGRAHGSRWVGEMGQLYLFQFPLILLGLVGMLQVKGRRLSFFLLWTIVTIVVLLMGALNR